MLMIRTSIIRSMYSHPKSMYSFERHREEKIAENSRHMAIY